MRGRNKTLEKTIIIACSILSAVIAASSASLAAAKGNSVVGSKALECMSRQPEFAQKTLINSLIYIGMIEAVPIITIVIAILLLLANPFL